MTMTKQKRTEIISKFKKNAKDTGNSSVQIALLTERIRQISDHLKGQKKDYASQLGLLKLVGQRRRLLNYVKRTDLAEYNKLLKQLDIRK
ncbi:MAG: 30S ribosomal protein S15 [Elusimicrobia bacterium]|nr:30S ribosomal protein S15 [Elusimicrobiota bacterium]